MNAPVSITQDLGIPAIYIHVLAELLHKTGTDERHLLLRVGLDPDRLNSVDLRICQTQAVEFVTRAIMESGEPGLGIMLAQELKLPLHGALGTAVMSSRTLEDALELMTRYLALRAPQLSVTRRVINREAQYTISCDRDLEPLRGFIMDTMLSVFVFMSTQLTNDVIEGSRVLRREPEPAHFHRFRQAISVPVQYGAEEDALVIPLPKLNLPIRFADDQLAASSQAQCEQALRQLIDNAGFSCRVRRVIETSYPFPSKLARVATSLFVSERTLKRRLQEENASFQHLVDQVRLERARELLRSTNMNLSQIADALGYADAANFTRAFKRWTGASPSQYQTRKLHIKTTPKQEHLPATV